MLKIIDIDYLKGYKMMISYNNGTTMETDLIDLMDYPAFRPLAKKEMFIQYADY